MASTYTVNLGIEKIGTGEQSGTWGDTTNTNFDLIDQAVNGAVAVTLASAGTSGSPNTLAITDGATSDGRNKFIDFDDGGDLGATAYVQLTPNDAEKIVHMRNSLSGGRSVIVFQGTYNASNDFEIPNGKDVLLKFDGAGASATVTDVFTDLQATAITTPDLTATTADINGGTIDGATIATSDITVGSGKTLDVSAGTLTLANDQISGDAINGGTIGSITITSADINGGTMDGVTIGGSSAGAITGTTGQFNTSLNVDGTVTADGADLDGAVVINQSGADVDFRVESDTNEYALFVDAGNSRVGINESSPLNTLHVKDGDSGATGNSAGQVFVEGNTSAGISIGSATTNSSYVWFGDSDNIAQGRIRYDNTTDKFQFRANNVDDILVLGSAEAVFNEGSNDQDFRVESDSNANMLFVDAGNSRVGIGTGSPSNTLEVVDNAVAGGITLSGANAPRLTLNDTSDAAYAALSTQNNGDVNLLADVTNASAGTTMGFSVDGSTRMVIDENGGIVTTPAAGGHAVFNQNSVDADFRVESDNDTHALFVRGSDGNVGIGDSTPAGKMEIAHNFASGTADRLLYLNSANGLSGGLASPVYGLYADIVGNNDATEVYGAYIDATPGLADPVYGLYAQSTHTYSNRLSVAVYAKGIVNSGAVGQNPVGADAVAGVYAKGSTTGTGYASTVTALTAHNESTYGSTNYGAVIKTEVPTTPASTDSIPIRAYYGSSILLDVIANTTTGVPQTVINQSGLDHDFRVESDTNNHALFVDAGNSRVGINESSPTEALDVTGNVTISGSLSKGSGSFKIDHPVKPDTHYLVHSFVEAPQADNIYRGKVELVDGTATVNIDTVAGMTEGTFALLNREVQCFTSNESGWTAVRGKVDGNILTIEAQDPACTDTISWMVVGERQDQHMYDTDWTDENGKVIVEPLKKTEGA